MIITQFVFNRNTIVVIFYILFLGSTTILFQSSFAQLSEYHNPDVTNPNATDYDYLKFCNSIFEMEEGDEPMSVYVEITLNRISNIDRNAGTAAADFYVYFSVDEDENEGDNQDENDCYVLPEDENGKFPFELRNSINTERYTTVNEPYAYEEHVNGVFQLISDETGWNEKINTRIIVEPIDRLQNDTIIFSKPSQLNIDEEFVFSDIGDLDYTRDTNMYCFSDNARNSTKGGFTCKSIDKTYPDNYHPETYSRIVVDSEIQNISGETLLRFIILTSAFVGFALVSFKINAAKKGERTAIVVGSMSSLIGFYTFFTSELKVFTMGVTVIDIFMIIPIVIMGVFVRIIWIKK